VTTFSFYVKEVEAMEPRVVRASGAAGVLAAVLTLAGLFLLNTGQPGASADARAWATWAKEQENSQELGVYVLLIPGLLLFLVMFAALAGLLPAEATSRRLAGYGAIGFFVLLAAAGVLFSTTASTFGFFEGFEDPTAVTVFFGVTAGYHLETVGVWSLALTMLATAVGLRYSRLIPQWSLVAIVVLSVLAIAGGVFGGFGVVFGLVWMVAVGVWLLLGRGGTRSTR
jgi:hypothetical protein